MKRSLGSFFKPHLDKETPPVPSRDRGESCQAEITAPAGGPSTFVEEAGLESTAGQGTRILGVMFLGFCIPPALPSCSSLQPLNPSGCRMKCCAFTVILTNWGNSAVIFLWELCGQKCCYIVLFSPLENQNKFS